MKSKYDKFFPEYPEFQYYQPNVHNASDCVIRAAMHATGKTWYEIFDGLVAVARKMQRIPNEPDVYNEYFKTLGLTWHAIKPQRGDKRPTVCEFAKDTNNGCQYIASVANHLVAIGNGKYYDINPYAGHKCLYGYFVIIPKR